MRAFVAVLLSIGLWLSPNVARAADETAKEETPAAAGSFPSAPKAKETVKAERSAIESEMEDLRELVEEQRAELEAQRAALKAEQLKMEALEKKFGAASSESVTAPATSSSAAAMEPVAAAATVAPSAGSSAVPSAGPAAQGGNDEVSPLQLKVGSAYITPVGFMDFTAVWRNHDGGSGIGTNFAGIPYGNTYATNLSEFRMNMQNSRIGFRVDAMVHGAHVIGYMESDFLGNNPGNVAVTSNSNTLRSRLYWADVRKGSWEVLGGQTWSLITPGRAGISPLPADVFYTQDMDVNYQAGLVWGRIPEFRAVYHPTNTVAFAVALDSPEQYIGGSAGAPGISLPSGLTALGGTQLNSGGTTLGVPNVSPDIIAKLAFDPNKKAHFEVGGMERQFKIWNPTGGAKNTITGGGAFLNVNFEIFKGMRLLSNNFWSDGGGRYIFGMVPDVIVRPDGSLSAIHTGSTVSGFEYTHGKTMLFAYYGGTYIGKDVVPDTVSGNPLIGYGTPTSSAQNRMIQEGTFGFNQTLAKDSKYGALNIIGQYSYLQRNPWATVNPRQAQLGMIFLDLRYTLPGSAPTLGTN